MLKRLNVTESVVEPDRPVNVLAEFGIEGDGYRTFVSVARHPGYPSRNEALAVQTNWSAMGAQDPKYAQQVFDVMQEANAFALLLEQGFLSNLVLLGMEADLIAHQEANLTRYGFVPKEV